MNFDAKELIALVKNLDGDIRFVDRLDAFLHEKIDPIIAERDAVRMGPSDEDMFRASIDIGIYDTADENAYAGMKWYRDQLAKPKGGR